MLASLRNFVITFIISLLIFGPIAYYLSDLLIDCVGPGFGIISVEDQEGKDTPDIITTPPTVTPDGPISTNGTSFNMLVIGTDYQPSILKDYSDSSFMDYPMFENTHALDPNGSMSDFTAHRSINADTIVLIRADKANGRFVFSYIPPEMIVLCGGVEMTLNETYTTMGIEYLTSKITSVTGFTIDFYTIIDMNGVEALVNSLEGITVNVPCDMKYSDPAQNLYIDLKAGVRKLSGADALDLIRFNNYPTNASFNRGTVTMSFVNALAQELSSESAIKKIDSIYRIVTGYATTTFGTDDLREHTDLLTKFDVYTKTILPYPGYYDIKNGRTVFIPNTSNAISAFSEYR